MKQIFTVLTIGMIALFIAFKGGLLSFGLSLDSVEPTEADQGYTIRLSGNGLGDDPQNTLVFFNDISVKPKSVADDALLVQVPPNAMSGVVHVQVAGKSTNQKFFKVLAKGGSMPAGHPDIGSKGMGGMQGMGNMGSMGGGSMQQASPGTDNTEPSASAHEFYDVETAKDYIDFKLPNKAGKMVSLSDHLGSVILLNFWATWCKPCLEEVPSLERLNAKAESMGLKIFAVSVDESFSDIEKALPNTKLDILLDPKREIAKKYGTVKFPETWIIDKKGKIIGRFIGSRNWDSETFMKFFSLILKKGSLPAGMGGGMGGKGGMGHGGMGGMGKMGMGK